MPWAGTTPSFPNSTHSSICLKAFAAVLPRGHIHRIACRTWVAQNLLFIAKSAREAGSRFPGPPGVGKSHLSFQGQRFNTFDTIFRKCSPWSLGWFCCSQDPLKRPEGAQAQWGDLCSDIVFYELKSYNRCVLPVSRKKSAVFPS